MYSLSGYGEMIADRVRIAAYVQALRQAVRPGAVVVDIGTGPGIMAVLACQLGASRVYAIESDEIIQVARAIAAANGCADRIEFIEDLSTKVTLPVRADVIVSDMRGVLPFLGTILRPLQTPDADSSRPPEHSFPERIRFGPASLKRRSVTQKLWTPGSSTSLDRISRRFGE